MEVTLSPIGGAAQQFFDSNGNPLSGGFIYTYAAGTSTPQATYTTSVGNVQHSNPIQLDAAGRVPGGEIWILTLHSYKFIIKDANNVLVASYDNIYGITDASQITYFPPFTNAVEETVQEKLAQTVSVIDFGADPTGVVDSTIAFNNAINAAYTVEIPDGTYLISGVIKLGENRQGNIRLNGASSQHTELRLTTADAQLRCNVNHAWVVLNNIKINGNGVANHGLVVGAIGTFPGSGSVDYFNGVVVTGCVSHGFVFYGLQYSVMNDLLATNNGGTGIYCYSCGNLTFNRGIVNTNDIGIWLGGDGSTYSACSSIWFNDVDNYDNDKQFLYLYSAFNIYQNNCTYENETVLPTPMISIEQHGSYYTSNIYFNGCIFQGLPHDATLIDIGYGNIPNVTFFQCRAIYPNPGYYIVSSASLQPFMVSDCYGGGGYSDYFPSYWDGHLNGLYKESRTQNDLIQQDFVNNKVGFNHAPIFQYDFITPNATPSGTTTVVRYVAENWNGTDVGLHDADSLVYTSSTSSVGYNRGARIDTNTNVITIGTSSYSGGQYIWATDGNVAINDLLRPYTDNTFSLGYGSYRWSVVYAATGAINTSDENEKTDIRPLDYKEKAVALAIKARIKAFKFNEAVDKKGNKARIHFGVIAQDVKDAFEAEQLDPNQYGVFCSDTWYELNGEIVEKDENGNYPYGAVSKTRLGVRYDELFAFIIGSI